MTNDRVGLNSDSISLYQSLTKMSMKEKLKSYLSKISQLTKDEFKEDYDKCRHYFEKKSVRVSPRDEIDECFQRFGKIPTTIEVDDTDKQMHQAICPCCGDKVEVTDEHYSKQCRYEFDEEKKANPDTYEVNKIKKEILSRVDFEGRDTKRLDVYITNAEGHSGENELRELMRKHQITVESLIGRPYKYDISLDYSKPDYLRMGVEIYELIYPTQFPRSEEYMNKRNTFVRDFIAYSNNPKEMGCWIFWPYKNVVNGEIKPTERTIQLWNEFSAFLKYEYSESEKELLGKFLCVNNAISTLVDEHHLDFKGVLEYIRFNAHDDSFRDSKDSMYYKEMTNNERVMKRDMEQRQIEKYVTLTKKMNELDPERDALIEKEEKLNSLLWTDALDKETTIIRPIDFDDEMEIECFWSEQLFKVIYVKTNKNMFGERAVRVMYTDYQKVMKAHFDEVKTKKYLSTKEAYYKMYNDAKNELKEVKAKLEEINKVYIPLWLTKRKLRGKMEYTTYLQAEEKCKE